MNHLLNHALSLLAGVPCARPFAAQVAHPARRLARSGIAHRVDRPPLRRFENHIRVALRRRADIAKELHDLLFIGKGCVIRAALGLKRRFDRVFHLREHRIHRHDIRQVPAAFHQIAAAAADIREIFQHVDHVDQPPHDDRGERDAVCAHLLGNLLKARLRVRRAAVGDEHHMLALCAVKRLERVAGQTQRPGKSRQFVGVSGFDAVDRVQHRLLVPHRRHFHKHLRVV